MQDVFDTSQDLIRERMAALRREREQLHKTTLEAASYRQAGLFDHGETTARLAASLVAQLRWPGLMFEDIGTAALLHEIGMIGVPDSTLHVQTEDARRETETVHVKVVLALFENDASVSSTTRGAIKHHHERWDGSGVPDGLVGEAIPTLARVLAVSSEVVSLSFGTYTWREMQPSDAVCAVQAESRTRFDPEVIEALVSLERAGVVGRALRSSAAERR
jgi:response regulator RpfG family c-di-GMP phosphodiesterase